MFRGGFEHQVDDKGRIIIPVRFREFLSPACFITRGLHNCLFVFPWAKWIEIEEKLKTAPITDLNALAMQRFFGTGIEANLDGQGRLILPPRCGSMPAFKKTSLFWGRLIALRYGPSLAGLNTKAASFPWKPSYRRPVPWGSDSYYVPARAGDGSGSLGAS